MPWRVGPDQEELHVSTLCFTLSQDTHHFKEVDQEELHVSTLCGKKKTQNTHHFPFQGHTEQMYDRLHEAKAEV